MQSEQGAWVQSMGKSSSSAPSPPSSSATYFLSLPLELRHLIYSQLTTFSLLRLSFVCRSTYIEINNEPRIIESSPGYFDDDDFIPPSYADSPFGHAIRRVTAETGGRFTPLTANNVGQLGYVEEVVDFKSCCGCRRFCDHCWKVRVRDNGYTAQSLSYNRGGLEKWIRYLRYREKVMDGHYGAAETDWICDTCWRWGGFKEWGSFGKLWC
ncbi:hypothetical protein BJ508DRAFT_414337 [Ascobolus immersus RN42]|uniref:F-box domain-containing protein n=1 Tax=Ascobolus immersus RN42 TaxID=1160509 RepID=A0A3N4I9F0_ASCIM|nr:hypothetical protein BJ508DRAFT_414337 [Ascobolus immersus RN42]